MTTAISSDTIRAAINDILTVGQSVRLGDRSYEYADIDVLRKMLAEAEAAERTQPGQSGMFTRVRFGRVC